MAQFDPTVVLVVMLAVVIFGSTRIGLRFVKSPALLGAAAVGLWAAFLANQVASGEPHAAAMFGWFDEHEIISEFHRLHMLSLSFGTSLLTLLFGVTVAVFCLVVLRERGLGGQITATLRFFDQLPRNLAAFLLGGISDTPHGPPSIAFA